MLCLSLVGNWGLTCHVWEEQFKTTKIQKLYTKHMSIIKYKRVLYKWVRLSDKIQDTTWLNFFQINILLPWEIWQCLKTFLSLYGLLLVSRIEAKGAAKPPTMHRPAHRTKNYLVQNVNSAKVDKSCIEATRECHMRKQSSN